MRNRQRPQPTATKKMSSVGTVKQWSAPFRIRTTVLCVDHKNSPFPMLIFLAFAFFLLNLCMCPSILSPPFCFYCSQRDIKIFPLIESPILPLNHPPTHPPSTLHLPSIYPPSTLHLPSPAIPFYSSFLLVV